MGKVELLAPAGNYECFEAALKGGADAVYLGLNVFGARASAENFSEEEVLQALEKAHMLGKKIYLTVNTLLKDAEIASIYDHLYKLYINGLDGVIVQDTGVMRIIAQSFPKLSLHASTQMAITDVKGVQFAKRLGVTRVVPARELLLEEISNIHKSTGMELECFIHGAMCYSYSGKCLFSSFLGGRSGNRGRCAQPCRLPYGDQYILSMKDLSTIDLIPELIEAGIGSFKIEGRMKSPEYVYGVTSLYRKYIDEYYRSGVIKVSDEDREVLLSLYTRGGNCKGYYKQKNGRNMLTITSPSYESGNSLISISKLPFPKIPISLMCNIYKDTEICVCITLLEGNESNNWERQYTFTFDVIPEVAKNNAASEESVRKQMIKCGNTDFVVNECIVNIGEGLFVTNGQLNQIRRDSLSMVREAILNGFIREDDSVRYVRDSKRLNIQAKSSVSKAVNVSVIDYLQLMEVTKADMVTGVIIPINLFDFENDYFREAISETIKARKYIYIRLPYIVRRNGVSESEVLRIYSMIREKIKQNYDYSIAGVYVSNYECIELFNALHNDELKIIADIHMYCTNSVSVDVLQTFGVTHTTVPVELSEKELIRRNIRGEELIIYGRMPMVVSSQCILKTAGKCSPAQTGNKTVITDRKSAELFCYTNCMECSNVIYNSVPNSLLIKKELLSCLEPSSYRLDFTCESNREVRDILNRLEMSLNSDSPVELCDKYTRGHMNKGVD